MNEDNLAGFLGERTRNLNGPPPDEWAPDEQDVQYLNDLEAREPPPDDDPEEHRVFRRWSATELAKEPDNFNWLIKGMLAEPTYGQVGGEMKTLKSYVGLFTALALASGEPVFGHFTVRQPRPVLAYVGEGGRIPFQRRLRRVAHAMNIDLDDLPLEVAFDVAPISSDRFRRSLTRDLDEIHPGLVWIDPYYAYHGTTANAANLHDEGGLLTGLSKRCTDAGASLLVNNHFNQTGNGTNLKRITMAGSGEWVDTWLLLAHRQDPDVENGLFWLNLAIGSRQWGGRDYTLDLDIGRFDPDTGQHYGDITWHIATATAARSNQEADAYQVVIDVLETHPWELTKQQLVESVGGKAPVTRALIDALAQDRRIRCEHLPRREGNRTVRRYLYALADEPRPDQGTPLDGVA